MSSAHQMLVDAREDFARFRDHRSAAELLDAAYTAWNEEEIGECDFADEVQAVAKWMAKVAREEIARTCAVSTP